MQKVMLIGRLGNDPEKKMVETKGGNVPVTTFSLASNFHLKGEQKTLWWRISVWGTERTTQLSFMKKGTQVMIYGDLQQPRIYQSASGENRIALDVTARDISFVGSSGGQSGEASGEASGGNSEGGSVFAPISGQSGQNTEALSASSLDDDEVPF